MRQGLNKRIIQNFIVNILCFLIILPIYVESLVPNIQSDGTGNMLTIWEEIDPVTNNGAVFSNSLPFLGGWSGPVQVSQVGQHSTNPQAVIDSSGNSVILWISQDTTKRNYLLYGAEKTLLGNWSSPALISLSSDDVNVDFRFVFLDTGLLRVVWSSILDEKIYTSDTTFNTWTWSAPLLISN